LWVEVSDVDSKLANGPSLNISPAPVEEFEVRLVVWHTKDMEDMDIEGCSDLYIKASFDPEKEERTDIHWRCEGGKGSFNWRILLPVKNNQESYVLTVEAWDKDIIASDDLIGKFNIDLTPMMQDAFLTKRQQFMHKDYWNSYLKQAITDLEGEYSEAVNQVVFEEKDKFWVPVKRFKEEEGESVETGQVLLSMQILTKANSEKQPQGRGRDSPNDDPHLPEPEGRIKLSMNPFSMLMQMIPSKMRRKIMLYLCLALCCSLCIMMAPIIISNGISKLIFG
jgi:hypothetical protein